MKGLTIVKRAVSIILGLALALGISDYYFYIITSEFSDLSSFYTILIGIMLASMLVFLVLWNILKSKLVHVLHIVPVSCIAIMIMFIIASEYSDLSSFYTILIGIMLVSMLVFLVLWNILKSKLVHVLHIVSVLCVAIMSIETSRYERRYRDYFENYLGYYISANDPSDIHIVRLSLHGRLSLQPMAIVNNELIEDGRRIVLNRNPFSAPYRIRFDAAWHTRNNTYVVLYKNWRSGRSASIEYHTQTGQRFRLHHSGAVANAIDILEIYHSVLSFDARKRHTGTFVLHDYEIIDIYNSANPINEDDIMNEKIIVEMNEEGFLVAIRHNAEETSFGRWGFRFQGNSKRRSLRIGCGLAGFISYRISEFIDENTILYERFFVSFPSWFSTGYIWLYNSDHTSRVHYRIIFKRKDIAE